VIWRAYVTVVGAIFSDGSKDSIVGDSSLLVVLLLRLGGLVLRVVVAHDVRVWFDVKSEMERHKTRNWRLVHSGDTRYIITF
jgi:hypothetical protein